MKTGVTHIVIVLCFFLSYAGAASGAEMSGREEKLRAVLGEFLTAFEYGDTGKMATYFAEDALTFPRAIMSNNYHTPIRVDDYRRVSGIDPEMLAAVEDWKANRTGPPYISLQPEDLDIKMYREAAIVTFHLTRENTVQRRSIVLSDRGGEWKIVHLHASNVIGSK